MDRQILGKDAVREALDVSMKKDENVVLIGQGVPDATQTYGTTTGLLDQYGKNRVYEMPLSESAMTGIMMGSSLVGCKPVMTFARLEFALLAIDSIVNQAAKWCYMFNGKSHVPITLRFIIGRGWGQGAQHSQSLHSWFAHIPGLKVVLPATPYDLKGLLISSIEDPNPVIFIEHRWLHYNYGSVPEGHYTVPIGKPNLLRKGDKATVVSLGYMTIDSIKASNNLRREGIEVDLIDLRTLNPLDDTIILESVKKTGRLIICDHASLTGGFSGEIIAKIYEKGLTLESPPIRISLPDCPTPTTRGLANYFYPTVKHIENAVKKALGIKTQDPFLNVRQEDLLDIPDNTFKGPF